MKLKLDFVNKVPKQAIDNEIILVKDRAVKNKILKSSNKSLFKDKLFLEKKFFVKNIKDKNVCNDISNKYDCKSVHFAVEKVCRGAKQKAVFGGERPLHKCFKKV